MNETERNWKAPVDACAAGMADPGGLPHAQHNEYYIRTRTCAILRELGVPAHLGGFLYLVEAVALAVLEPERLRRITADLYPAVARRYRTTPAAVERAMRHAIETAWSQTDPDTLRYYFGSTVSPNRGRPNNSELIARVANMVRQGGVS